MRTIEATMFIVPNNIMTVESQLKWERAATAMGLIGRLMAITDRVENIFGKLSKDDKLIRVWVFEDENPNDEDWSENWSDHGRRIPEWDEPLRNEIEKARGWDTIGLATLRIKKCRNLWPSHFPLSKISHLNDGDVLEVTWKGCNIRLKVDQLNTRYGSITGDFQSALKRVVKTAY